MKDERISVFRLANLIRDRLVAQQQKRLIGLGEDGSYIDSAMQQYLAICRKVAKATARNWISAADYYFNEAHQTLGDLRGEIDARLKQQSNQERPAVASLGNIVADLDQIESEFHSWEFDPKEQDLSVQTEPIELKGVELGEFQITLHLKTLNRPDPVNSYSIIALDANPATGRDGVVHPHVSDKRLCPGDATIPIRSSLESGLICDFFLLVRSVLQTYNAQSAYVQLERWDGTSCSDCGDTMSHDEGSYCEFCDNNVCDSCCSYCRKCEMNACLGCLETCPECDEQTCPHCMKRCSECDEKCCGDCLIKGLCPSCHEKKENNHEPDDHETASAGTEPVEESVGTETDRDPDSALHADRLGQAAVLLSPG